MINHGSTRVNGDVSKVIWSILTSHGINLCSNDVPEFFISEFGLEIDTEICANTRVNGNVSASSFRQGQSALDFFAFWFIFGGEKSPFFRPRKAQWFVHN